MFPGTGHLQLLKAACATISPPSPEKNLSDRQHEKDFVTHLIEEDTPTELKKENIPNLWKEKPRFREVTTSIISTQAPWV